MANAHGAADMEVKDCSTWFLVENQSKMTYPLPPRFSAHTVSSCGLLRVWERYLSWLLHLFHVEISSLRVRMTCVA